MYSGILRYNTSRLLVWPKVLAPEAGEKGSKSILDARDGIDCLTRDASIGGGESVGFNESVQSVECEIERVEPTAISRFFPREPNGQARILPLDQSTASQSQILRFFSCQCHNSSSFTVSNRLPEAGSQPIQMQQEHHLLYTRMHLTRPTSLFP